MLMLVLILYICPLLLGVDTLRVVTLVKFPFKSSQNTVRLYEEFGIKFKIVIGIVTPPTD
jgi:hypothetical protein